MSTTETQDIKEYVAEELERSRVRSLGSDDRGAR